ncbi:uncharacterized protein LOC143362132 isoform X2 [Halictus rubicundus]|uniref:uncharacterized protein LOC143362132 isoform X2 n=1 Tax=Halictus rubicundus TaxID=77578 RepID=UPI0040363F5C
MSLVLKYDESFYDVLRQYFVQLIDTMPSILKVITLAGGVIAVTSYAFYRAHVVAHRYRRITRKTTHDSKDFQEIQNHNRSIVRQRSIISHKDMFRKLEYSANKCYDKVYALKCIDIVVYCPQLLNVKSPINGITPFHRVCYHGHTCLITFMLGKGADPSIATIAGENALCMAVYYFLNNPLQSDFSCLEILHETGLLF